MTRRTRRMTFAIIGAIVLLVAITPFVMDVNQFRPFIEGKASAALGRQVDLGNLKLSLSSASLTTETLVIADDPAFSSTPFLEARSVSVGVELLPLILSRALEVTTITIESPQVTVIRNSAGRWNYSSLGSSSSLHSGNVPFKKLEWKNGRVIVGSTHSKRRSVYDHVDVTASAVSLTSMFPVSASGDLDGGGHFTPGRQRWTAEPGGCLTHAVRRKAHHPWAQSGCEGIPQSVSRPRRPARRRRDDCIQGRRKRGQR